MEFPRVEPTRVGAVRRGHRLLVGCILGAVALGSVTACSAASSVPDRPVQEQVTRQPSAVARSEPWRDVDLSTLPAATTFGRIPAAPTDPAPHSETEGVVLHVKSAIAVFDAPAGRPIAKLPPKQFKSPTWVPIVDERGHWARVLLPSRPNHSTGWVRVGTDKVEKAYTPYVVDVDLDARELVIRKEGREIGSWTVAVGSPESPTPRGRTFILASIREMVTDYSPIILPLGTHSDTYTTYGGGPGTVGLHGWPDPSVFGTASSDGCVRVPAEALRELRALPLGTLVRLH